MTQKRVSEKAILFLLAAVQFVNILDFMMVMPLGPDFAHALNMPLEHLGYVGGSYTLGAALAGFVGIFYLERFNRRTVFLISILGLSLGTLLGAFATNSASLITARFIAGLFGGPASSLTMAIVADTIPVSHRGRAMGIVVGAFSIASVLGVPFSLELATSGGWRAPFIAVTLMGLAAYVLAYFVLPRPYRPLIVDHDHEEPQHPWQAFKKGTVLIALALTLLTTLSLFLVVPHIASYMQENLNFPRSEMSRLYLVGGVLSLIGMHLTGTCVDRFGSALLGTAGLFGMLGLLWAGFYDPTPNISIYFLFGSLMLIAAVRNVSLQTLHSKVPTSNERATYMSAHSTLTNFGCAAGAFLSSQMLHQAPDGSLEGMPAVALLSMVLTALTLPLLWWVETHVRDRYKTSA